MGTTRKRAERLIGYEAKGLLPASGLIAELGSQEFTPPLSAMAVQEIFRRYRPGTDLSEAAAAEIGAERWLAALYEALGFRYVSFDIALGRSSRFVDLNFEPVPADLLGQADIVTNFGTTEHILNQLNCFRFIHELTKPGGLIWHNLPASDYFGHGFFKYDPNFFFSMADANGYEVISWNVTLGMPSEHFHQIPEFLFDLGMPRVEHRASSIDMVFRKRNDVPFVLPIDAPIATIERIAIRLRLLSEEHRVLIYGAGSLGERLARDLAGRGVRIAGFLDSDREGSRAGLPVHRFADHRPEPDDVIIIASSFAPDIRETLRMAGLTALIEVTGLD